MEAKRYTTAAAFRRALEDRLKDIAGKQGVDLQRLRRQVAFDRLLARLFQVGQPLALPCVLKGGYAMELRIKAARTTKDIDLTMRSVEAASSSPNELPLLMTIALSSDCLRNQEQIHDLLDVASSRNPAGFYVVFEHPDGEYLVSDPNWLANALDLMAGLRLRGREVVVGYCTHQFLIAGLAKV